MEKIKELYEKVAKDTNLQAKFAEIMKDAGKIDKGETEKRLVTFLKEAGYEVTIEEISGFLKLLESNENALSEEEMDSVAGGELSASKPKLSTTGKGCPIRHSVVSDPGQQCPL